jgi:tRNA(Ile)-lysidine synthase TilS/MesJ
MDETVPDIFFNIYGICKYCLMSNEINKINNKLESKNNFLSKIDNIKKNNKKYNCIAGVSGGRDSTFLLYILKKKLNLNPLAVHYDNGWNTDLSNRNIKNSCSKLGIDLHTVVANWKSFSQVQRALFFAGVPDVDTITELGIYKSLFEAASHYKCKYIMTGHNIDNEFMDPLKWTYFDGRYISSVCKEQGVEAYLRNIKIFYLKDLVINQIIK